VHFWTGTAAIGVRAAPEALRRLALPPPPAAAGLLRDPDPEPDDGRRQGRAGGLDRRGHVLVPRLDGHPAGLVQRAHGQDERLALGARQQTRPRKVLMPDGVLAEAGMSPS